MQESDFGKPAFVARHVVESIIHQAPLDDRFGADLGSVLEERVDEL
jgi:hypothetical protein